MSDDLIFKKLRSKLNFALLKRKVMLSLLSLRFVRSSYTNATFIVDYL